MLAGILTALDQGVWVPDPNLYSLEEWAAELPPDFNDIPRVVGDNWVEWADALCLSNIGLQYGIPSAVGFDDWKSWAMRVYQVLM